MKLCDDRCDAIEAYLDGRLGGEVRALFEAHLPRCEACNRGVEEWRTIRRGYREWSLAATSREVDRPAGIDPKAFVAAVLEKMATGDRAKAEKRTPKRYLWVAAASFVTVSLAGYILLSGLTSPLHHRPADPKVAALSPEASSPGTPQPPDRDPLTTVEGSPAAPAPGRVLSAPRGGKFSVPIMDDIVGGDESSAVQLVEVSAERTVYRMLRGTVAFDVAPRPVGASFRVTAGGFSIEVIGTRFGVTMRDTETVTVFVREGTVAVSSPGERILLHAGGAITLTGDSASAVTEMDILEAALLDELLSGEITGMDTDDAGPSDPPDAAVIERPSPRRPGPGVSPHRDIEAWRTLILEGEIEPAKARIKHYLRGNPRDMEATMLIAVCEKKQGRYKEAAATYERVAASGDPRYADTARYLAAELKQSKLGRYREALALLDDYLSNAPKRAPNRAEARFRKAECLLAMGERDRAGRILTALIEDYGRSSIANRARRLRASMDAGGNPSR